MSTNNDEAKVSRTCDGTKKAFPAFMPWLKGILMYEGFFYIIKVTIESLLPESEMATSQMIKQTELVKDNQVGMGIVTMNIKCPSLIVKIKNLTTEDWPSSLLYKVTEMLNKKYHPKDITSRVVQK